MLKMDLMGTRMLLPRHMLPGDTCFPMVLVLQIVSGVGATISEGEGLDEGERIGVGEGDVENEFRF